MIPFPLIYERDPMPSLLLARNKLVHWLPERPPKVKVHEERKQPKGKVLKAGRWAA